MKTLTFPAHCTVAQRPRCPTPPNPIVRRSSRPRGQVGPFAKISSRLSRVIATLIGSLALALVAGTALVAADGIGVGHTGSYLDVDEPALPTGPTTRQQRQSSEERAPSATLSLDYVGGQGCGLSAAGDGQLSYAAGSTPDAHCWITNRADHEVWVRLRGEIPITPGPLHQNCAGDQRYRVGPHSTSKVFFTCTIPASATVGQTHVVFCLHEDRPYCGRDHQRHEIKVSPMPMKAVRDDRSWFEKYVDTIGDAADSVIDWGGDTASNVIDWSEDAADSVVDWGEDTVSNVIDWSEDTAGDIKSWLVGCRDDGERNFAQENLGISCGAWWSDAISWQGQFTEDVADGFLWGIAAEQGAVPFSDMGCKNQFGCIIGQTLGSIVIVGDLRDILYCEMERIAVECTDAELVLLGAGIFPGPGDTYLFISRSKRAFNKIYPHRNAKGFDDLLDNLNSERLAVRQEAAAMLQLIEDLPSGTQLISLSAVRDFRVVGGLHTRAANGMQAFDPVLHAEQLRGMNDDAIAQLVDDAIALTHSSSRPITIWIIAKDAVSQLSVPQHRIDAIHRAADNRGGREVWPRRIEFGSLEG